MMVPTSSQCRHIIQMFHDMTGKITVIMTNDMMNYDNYDQRQKAETNSLLSHNHYKF